MIQLLSIALYILVFELCGVLGEVGDVLGDGDTTGPS